VTGAEAYWRDAIRALDETRRSGVGAQLGSRFDAALLERDANPGRALRETGTGAPVD
jgi:hypothetical protein